MNHHRYVRAAVILAAALALAAGCGDKKHTVVGPGTPTPYPKLSSPENVMAALALSYQRRDSVETKLIYDENYQGTSIDPYGPPMSFYKWDEIRHVVALARTPTITSVTLLFPYALTRFTDLGDPPGWASIEVTDARIEINDITSYAVSSGETMQFKFVPTTPDSTSPTDTTWKLVRWFETKY